MPMLSKKPRTIINVLYCYHSKFIFSLLLLTKSTLLLLVLYFPGSQFSMSVCSLLGLLERGQYLLTIQLRAFYYIVAAHDTTPKGLLAFATINSFSKGL